MQALGRMDIEHRRTAVARATMRIAELNAQRDDDFQDLATAQVILAKDAFRAEVGAEIPGPRVDPLLDALMELQRAIDGSPESVRAACDTALEAAGVPLSSETSPAAR